MQRLNYTILAVGEHSTSRQDLIKPLVSTGYRVLQAATLPELKIHISSGTPISLALIDLKDKEVSGYEAIGLIKEEHPDVQIIVISRKNSTKEAIEAQQRGGFCYFAEPIDLEEFLFLTAKAIVVFELANQNRELKTSISSAPLTDFIGRSAGAKNIIGKVKHIKDVDTTILISGETGTGKTALARYIHIQGNRHSEPFVSLSCASIPRDLLEAELFGYEKGAFTGAMNRKLGSIELADKGTLFLDEIGDLPLELQPKLLTFLQDRQVKRLGSNTTSKVDVRIIAATNKNLAEMVQASTFREELFFRINIVNLELPPLRERTEDISSITENFLKKLSVRRSTFNYRITKDAVSALQSYSWPGNIRELENILERSSLFCTNNLITEADINLPKGISSNTSSLKSSLLGFSLIELEKQAIIDNLKACGGDKNKAAKALGISLKTIYNKIAQYGLS